MRASALLGRALPFFKSKGLSEEAQSEQPKSQQQHRQAHLSRALPHFQRREVVDFEDLLPGRAKPHDQRLYRRPTPYPAARPPKNLEYTPFGPQKPEETLPPFKMAPEPDKPPPELDPQEQEQPPEPLPAQHVPDRVRAPARLHEYLDEPEGEPASPTRQPASLFPSLRPQDDPARQRRLGRSVYDALETHGHFGLVDGGETMAGGVRRLVLHVPKRNRGYALDVKVGDTIYANSARGTQARGRLDVLFVSRHKYVPPGHAVTSCAIGVPEEQWRRFTFW
jgi:hypothetical protein